MWLLAHDDLSVQIDRDAAVLSEFRMWETYESPPGRLLGNRDSGKSYTWNTLFGRTVRTGKHLRQLRLNPTEWVEVFLVSGSPEERHEYVGEILQDQQPRIVLCSMQYHPDVASTLDYFVAHDYFLFVHWLNPGYGDSGRQADSLDLIPHLLDLGALVGVRNGQVDPSGRIEEMRGFIYGWAYRNGLIRS